MYAIGAEPKGAREINIRQRNLQNYDDSYILDGRYYNFGCSGCHNFLNNDPDDMILQVRSSHGMSMLRVKDGKVYTIDSRTPFGSAPIAYTTWHPSGRLIAFSVNKVRQFFHSARADAANAMDLDSSMGIFMIDSNTFLTPSAFSNIDYQETFPAWSPDGKYLYFCRAYIPWTDRDKMVPEQYEEIKYNLVRISFDIENDSWGELETVLSSEKTGFSISQLKFSPDGKFLLFSVSDYSSLPAYHKESDLYTLDMNTVQYKRLECNSDRADSYHSWSSNSRWIAFCSKRLDGQFVRVFFSYFDENGISHKPFLLPQKDPDFYESCLKMFQHPELIKGPFKINKRQLLAAIRSPKKITGLDSLTTTATPSSSGYRGTSKVE